MPKTKNPQKQHERDAKKVVKFKRPKSKSKQVKQTSKSLMQLLTDKQPKQRTRSKKSEAEKLKSKVQSFIKKTNAEVMRAENEGFKMNETWKQKQSQLTVDNIKTEAQLKKAKAEWSPSQIRKRSFFEINKIRSGMAPDGKSIVQPIMSKMSMQEISTATGRARAINRMLNFKRPIKKDGIMTMQHITSRRETVQLKRILKALGYDEKNLVEGQAIKTKYFELSDKWTFKQLGLYIKFKSLPDDTIIIEKIRSLAESAFSQRELYEAYLEQKKENILTESLSDEILDLLGDYFDSSILQNIIWRDVWPSDDAPDVYEYIVTNGEVMREKYTQDFDTLISMITNEEDTADIIKFIQSVTHKMWKSQHKKGGFEV